MSGLARWLLILCFVALAGAKFSDSGVPPVSVQAPRVWLVNSRWMALGFAYVELALALALAIRRTRAQSHAVVAGTLGLLVAWNVIEHLSLGDAPCSCLGRLGPVGFWPRVGIIGGMMMLLALSWPSASGARSCSLMGRPEAGR